MKTKNLVITIFILFTGSFAAAAQEQLSLTIDSAVRLAMDNNLSLRRSAIDLGTRQRNADRSWNSLLPSLGASAMISRPTSVTGPIEPESRDVWTPGFSINAGITLSASVIDNIKKARADYEAGLLTYEAARQELELHVRKLFYQMLLLDANRELAAINFASAQERHEQTAQLGRIGQAPRLDELSARVDMENLRPAMINAQILYENALDSFKTILGIQQDIEIKLEGDLSLEFTGGISAAGSNESLETTRLLHSIKSLELQRNAVRNGAYTPSLRLSWNSAPLYNLQNEIWNDAGGSFSISLGLNLDNFLPWSNTKTQIDAFNDNIRAAEIQLAETLRNRENKVNQNIRTIERILESLEALKLNIELAQSTYEMTEDAFKRGATDYQRLRGAGDSLAQAQNRFLQEQYNLIAALLDLEMELNIPFGTLYENI